MKSYIGSKDEANEGVAERAKMPPIQPTTSSHRTRTVTLPRGISIHRHSKGRNIPRVA
jgi:hypothetical protein